MVERLLISLLTLASSGVFAAHTVSAAPRDDDECVFPGECLRHSYVGINIGWGKCQNRSAWKERYIHGTPDERARMWKERGKPMSERIFDAYDLTNAQRTSCNHIREQAFKEWRLEMGEQFEESRGLRRRSVERMRELVRVGGEVTNGEPGAAEAWKKLTSARERLVDRGIEERRQEIKREHPFDWSDVADRIEDILPQEQAIRGRQRLAERFPFTISSRHSEKLGADKPTTGDRASDIDRWGAYVREFTARHQLTQGQSSAAASILGEVRAQDARLTHAMRDEVAHYQARANEESARRRREVFQFDIDDLFEGFKARLDGLLTTAQKQTATTP